MEVCQKRGVIAPTWSVNGGFVVVTFMRPTKDDTQDDTQGVPQDVPQDVPQGKKLDIWIEEQIKNNSKITTEELATISGYTSKTIKRHILKLTHIKYVGSGYSGHWEITDDNVEE
jgi:ATP-dependent DNA helicase RecG